MRKFQLNTVRSILNSFLFGAMAIAGCGSDGNVDASINLVDRSARSLTVDTVRAIKGTYGAGCIQRSGTWALGLNGYSPAESVLSVVKNNSACTLQITQIHAGTAALPVEYDMAAPFELSASYASSGAAFMLSGVGETVFYANFRIQADMSFANDFTIEMVYSDNLSETSKSKNSNYAVQSAASTAALVAAPDYNIELTGLVLQRDANNIVQSAVGSAQLTDGGVVGEQYVIDANTLGAMPSYAEVDGVFSAGTQVGLSGANPTIDAAQLNLVGQDLTDSVRRNVIVAHSENGTRSYQIFRLTFNAF